MFNQAKFLLSAAKPEHFPHKCDLRGNPLPEIAFVGRSNVGKSSLINHLTRKKGLAKTSSTPGKTQLINFFSIEEELCLVDLPGYGFAKVGKKKQAAWGDLIQRYLETRKNLKLTLLLLDIRHPPSEEDIAFAKWASHYGHELVIVFTKGDKLAPAKAKIHSDRNFALLLEQIDVKPDGKTGAAPFVPYSIKDGKGRTLLAKIIENRLKK